MAKKSNMTSHVLNLLTNRTGLTVDDLESSVTPKEKLTKKQVEAPIEKLPDEGVLIERGQVEEVQVEDVQVKEEQAERVQVEMVPIKTVINLSEKIRANLEKIEMLERANNTEGG